MTGTPYPKFYKRYIDTFGPKKGLEMVRRPHTLIALSLCPHFRNGAPRQLMGGGFMCL
jgi:hypothetical protein